MKTFIYEPSLGSGATVHCREMCEVSTSSEGVCDSEMEVEDDEVFLSTNKVIGPRYEQVDAQL